MQDLYKLAKYDYSTFLKKFAMRTGVVNNDDDSDNIFYEQWLNSHKKMPLKEPLEYKEEKAITEFVIALDTSSSVEAELVEAFVIKTYNILKQTTIFDSKINIHIIQCDNKIQGIAKITSQEEFEEYVRSMDLIGHGGADFRPVFSYVNEMIANKEFSDFKGLFYFSDGYGTFPLEKPDYNVAFVFPYQQYEIPSIPSWAVKLVLNKS